MTEQKEGFNLMIYRCDAGHVEIIWNSRDGITPFIIGCRKPVCNADMQHIAWDADVKAPDFKPPKGMRIFVDLTLEKARESRRRFVEEWWEKSLPDFPSMKDSGMFESKEAAIEKLSRGDLESFAPHTPDLIVVE